jgi:hypothetical protein
MSKVSISKHISGFRIIESAPRALSEDGSGLFCYRCKTDLGDWHGNPNLNKATLKNARKHCGVHRRKMREQL